MEALDFVNAIRENVISEDHKMYSENLSKNPPATDPVWKAMLATFSTLTDTQKKSILDFIRLVQVNTVSQMFGIIDGSSSIGESDEELVLTTVGDENVLSGDLQDIFLEMEEGD